MQSKGPREVSRPAQEKGKAVVEVTKEVPLDPVAEKLRQQRWRRAEVESDEVYLSNLMSLGGVAEALNIDHEPSGEDGKDRTKSGYVDFHNGVWRIQVSLALSTGIGDMHLSKWMIAKAETRIINIRPECEFLILAADGIGIWYSLFMSLMQRYLSFTVARAVDSDY
ncbi:hypothetical protein SSX86_010903 [Deinandra increscens subsp. villosa]|uniref:PPM-type phosphatase domain-containing protein n=1 Tax=Deinandra increscens subsp. villosa TaxID=3103831 RepID=A0AAP0H2Z5_9ASTR